MDGLGLSTSVLAAACVFAKRVAVAAGPVSDKKRRGRPRSFFSLSDRPDDRSLVLVCLVLAHKVCEDLVYNNSAWVDHSYDMITLKHLNTLEREALCLMGHNLSVDPDEVQRICHESARRQHSDEQQQQQQQHCHHLRKRQRRS